MILFIILKLMGNAHDIDTMNAHVAKMMQDKDIFAKIKDKSK